MTALSKEYRLEKDSMGSVKVPKGAYYGAQTQRAVENFPISGWRFQREMIHALGLIKFAAAKTNFNLGLMERRMARAIEKASEEVVQGRWDDQFVIDVFQTGSGTSTNMNANEVIANRANEILGSQKGIYKPVHPNDHVNLCQSSNDVFPSVIHIATINLLQNQMIPGLRDLHHALRTKEKEFRPILKIGRTHLKTRPHPIGPRIWRICPPGPNRHPQNSKAMESFTNSLWGTAVGTGINTHPFFARKVISMLNETAGERFHEAADHFEAQGPRMLWWR
jgi:fumarate hydratase class II